MDKRKIHKLAPVRQNSLITECKVWGKSLKGDYEIDATLDWRRVTCKMCLKHKRDRRN